MTQQIKPNRNYYKVACITVLIALQCVVFYYGVPSALDSFSEYWTGMSRHKADAIKGCAEHMPDITGGL
jgi:hypothetical protein